MPNNILSCILYVDDLMLFCKGTSLNIQVLSSLFTRYAQIYGQIINPRKLAIFHGSMSQARLDQIANSLSLLEHCPSFTMVFLFEDA